jgi:hypothetical protein
MSTHAGFDQGETPCLPTALTRKEMWPFWTPGSDKLDLVLCRFRP